MAPQSTNQNPFEDFNIQIDTGKLIAKLVPLLIILIIVIGAYTCFYTVGPEGRAVVKRFGKVVAIEPPGLHFKLPFMIDRKYFVPTERVLKEEFGFATIRAGQQSQFAKKEEHIRQSLMLTGDLNVVDVEWVVQYRIGDPDQFMHSLRNQRETIRVMSEVVMRRIVGNRLASDVLTVGRESIASLAKDEIQKALDPYEIGVDISTVELQSVNPPVPVRPAFNEVNEARQQRERMINEAEKQRNQIIPRAKGEALQLVAQAEGYEAKRINAAKGEAERFRSILEQYHLAPEITRQRLYLEMIDKVMPNAGKIYVVEEGTTGPIPLLHMDGSPGVVPHQGNR